MTTIRAALLLLVLLATSSAPAFAATNPDDVCANNEIQVLVPFPPFSIPLQIPSHGGCVSTVASRGNPVAAGDYSKAAYVAQCKLLQDVLPPSLWNAPVVIIGTSNIGGFGGKIETCTYLLHGYHSGTLSHP